MLSPSSAPHFLIEHKLISRADLLEGRICIEEIPRRHRGYLIWRDHVPHLFLKCSADRRRVGALAREASVYALLDRDGPFSGLSCLPRLVRFDTREAVLILEAVDGRSIAGDLLETGEGQHAPLARQLGRLIAALHQVVIMLDEDTELLDWDRAHPPPLFDYLYPNVDESTVLTTAQLQVITRIQQSPHLMRELDLISNAWHTECIVHGDLSLSNILVGNQGKSIVIIDWELAHIGDSCWDVATIMAELLSLWVFSMPLNPGLTIDQLTQLAWVPIRTVTGQIERFWIAYANHRKLGAADQAARFERVMQLAGVRLFQKALERGQDLPRITGHELLLCQLGMNMVLRTHDAIELLFGRLPMPDSGKAANDAS